MEGIIFYLIFIFIFFVMPFIKKVPDNTVIIIDRYSHYLKTKKSGYYFLRAGDEITTMISEKKLFRTVGDIYETKDGKVVPLTVTCEYYAKRIEDVLDSLANVRRSIDDIIKSATYYAVNGLDFDVIKTDLSALEDRLRNNLINELNSVSVTLTVFRMSFNYNKASTSTKCYTPTRDKCYGSDTKNYKHETAVTYNSSNDDGPIKYY